MTPMAAAAPAAGGGGLLSMLFLALPLILLLWLMMSQRRRAKAVQEAQSQLAVGQDVMLASGIYGTIAHLDGETVHLQVADGVILRVARRTVLPPGTNA